MESENILLGYQTLANDWQDGVLTAMLRKANRVSVEIEEDRHRCSFVLLELSHQLDLFRWKHQSKLG